MLRTDVMWRNGGRWLSLALLGGLALNATQVEAAPASTPGVQSWISLSNGQLCRTWSAPSSAAHELAASVPSMPVTKLSVNTLSLDAASLRGQTDNAKGLATTPASLKAFTVTGATSIATTHCTNQWRIAENGLLISGAPQWVPNPTGDWPTVDSSDTASVAQLYKIALKTKTVDNSVQNVAVRAVHIVVAKPAPPSNPHPTGGSAPAPSPAPYGAPPGGIGPWVPVPGHPSYGMSDFAGDPNASEFGVCTWWAWYMRRDEPQLGTLGMASQWITNARARGMRTGSTPSVGATVVFQPGVQGAGGGGHVGHVVAILSNGWFIISEMNFYWNGGGWGRVDYRYVHTGSGVAFIY